MIENRKLWRRMVWVPHRDRLPTVASGLNLTGTRAANWKLEMAGSGAIAVETR